MVEKNEIASISRCKELRIRLLNLSQNVTALHLAGSFSCIEILDCIYSDFLVKDDAFILSKGHAGIAQYAVLESKGLISSVELDNYSKSGSKLGVHPTTDIPGIYFGTGSLGHGLNISIGSAVIKSKTNNKVYVVISDGEMQEGSTWEGLLNAPALRLNNLTVVIDFNDFQSLGKTSETHPSLFPINSKMKALGWQVHEVDGHSYTEIFEALNTPHEIPKLIVANTIKGKGVSFMENVAIWHYRSPSADEYLLALNELRGFVYEK